MNNKSFVFRYALNLFLSWFCLITFSQSAQHNYIVERDTYGDGSQYRDLVHYYDGLGIQEQTVRVGITPHKNSLVESWQHDAFGSVTHHLLPVPCSTGAEAVAQKDIARQAITFYNDEVPLSRYKYEQSPLHRRSHVTGAGIRWHVSGHGVFTHYLLNDVNTDSLSCVLFEVSDTRLQSDTSVLVRNVGLYPSGRLRVESVKDEDNNVMLTFSTFSGLKVLERRMVSRYQWLDTYYVYDAASNLTAILPSSCLSAFSSQGGYVSSNSDILQQYGYFYLYDRTGYKRGKKMPGSDWHFFVHDASGTTVFSQDGVQRSRGQWSFTLCDVFGRVCLMGIGYGTFDVLHPCTSDFTITAERCASDAGLCGYRVNASNGIFLSSVEIHHVWYYDDYSFLTDDSMWGAENADFTFQHIEGYAQRPSMSARTHLTGEAVATFFQSSCKLSLRVYYYDMEGRVIQRYESAPLEQCLQESLLYDFTGNVLQRRISYLSIGLVEEHVYTYDHADRLSLETLSINGGPAVEILSRSYDEVGRLSSERHGGEDRFITSYGYNVRSWPISLYGTLFSERLFYESPPSGVQPMYSGYVSASQWSSGCDGMTLSEGYAYVYDVMKRLVAASYRGSKGKNFSTSYNYDKMGNIVRLQRYGHASDGYACVDNLRYQYHGNYLRKVTDMALDSYAKDVMQFHDDVDNDEEYFYDACGRLTVDLNKGISVSYSDVGYPQQVTTHTGCRVSYAYTFDGQRLLTHYETPVVNTLSLQHSSSAASTSIVRTSVLHFGNLLFRDGKLSMLLFGNGYIEFQNGCIDKKRYIYFFCDHLGSVRVAATNDQTIETNNYYPYGALYDSYSVNGTQPYKYNGKELDRMYGLDLLDYGARWYDPILARWHVIDSACEETPFFSPFAYCGCDPIGNIDPDGNSAKVFKIAFKLAKTVGKNGWSSLGKTVTYVDAVSDVVDNVSTLTDSNASITDRVVAGLSLASEFLPVSVGDVKDVSKMVNATVQKKIHGNTKLCTRAQHAYDIINKLTGKRVKTGVSGGRIRKDGKSYRAEKQVRDLNKKAGSERYNSEIVHYEPAGEGARDRILKYEKRRAEILKEELDPNIHKRP